MPDEEIPGTLNVGQALPTITEALIYIAIVSVDLTTLVAMILAAVLGAWLGVGLVSRLSRRAIQLAMGCALMCAALIGAVLANFVLGSLMMLGVGLYAPCLILVSPLIAAYLVKTMPADWLPWLVVAVVVYASLQMLRSARAGKTADSR